MRIPLNAKAGIPAKYANRHGLITGATGTGKTVSLMKLAQEFSRAGVPVFIGDVKGDISALARSNPCDLLDLFGQSGRHIHATFEAMGADLVARALELSDAQSACVEIAFAYARDSGLQLDTLAQFRALLHALRRAPELAEPYGHMTAASVGVVERALMRLASQGGEQFFAAPAYDVADLLHVDSEFDDHGTRQGAHGRISILAADRLIQSPRLYSAFLLWLLSDLYARLPEVGDLEKPRLVFFFDEAHLLFDGSPPALLRRIEQTVRLIRSKGVGVYFVSQAAGDIPPLIQAQLAHRVEHDRALSVGAARVRTMDSSGRPLPMQMVKVDLPDCPLGALDTAERPAAPAKDSLSTETGKFDAAGYAFLAFAACVVIGLIWGVWSIHAAGLWVYVPAGAAGIWLATRKARRRPR